MAALPLTLIWRILLKPVKIGLIGVGTVGASTALILKNNATEIARRAGRSIEVIHASRRNISQGMPQGAQDITLTADPFEVVNNPEVDIVIELIGGDDPALTLVLKAIENGKHVVTANKALIAMHGNEIFAAAQAQGVNVAFEAAVAGGVPIIKAIREGLSANHINWLAGIINGTGNFILTEMRDKLRDFQDVLEEAQRLGYAEADPAFDIEGIDAAHKLCILSSIAFGIPLQFSRVYTEGITAVCTEDVVYAEELGYRIKHLGIARRTGSGIEMRVHPTLIPKKRLIANVEGVMNAVLVMADKLGASLYCGPGAGAEPTASAVIADIIDVARTITTDAENRVPHLAFQPEHIADIPILPISEATTAYYIRMQVDDKPGVMAEITHIMGESDISIEAILQKQPEQGVTRATIIMLTQKIREKQMDRAIAKIAALQSVNEDIQRIRVEALETC